MARADHKISKQLLKKIALFCDVPEDYVIPAITVNSIYEVPLNYEQHQLAEKIAKKLNLGTVTPKLDNWEKLAQKIKKATKPVKVAFVGKYTGLDDAYLSVIESVKIAAYHQDHKSEVVWIDAEKLAENNEKSWSDLENSDCLIILGGFGIRGTEGKILAAKYARENKMPCLGICLGMQIMAIEYAREKLNDPTITSEEFDEQSKLDPDKYIVHFLPGQHKDKELLNDNDFQIVGINPKDDLVEMIEHKDHPFMIGCQFHPEFLSRPHNPHPLFKGLISAAIKK